MNTDKMLRVLKQRDIAGFWSKKMLNRLKIAIVLGLAMPLLCGSAFAASSGEQPLEEAAEATALATPSTETRTEVELEAAQNPPKEGQQPLEETTINQALSTPSTETRAEVEAEAAQDLPAAGQRSR